MDPRHPSHPLGKMTLSWSCHQATSSPTWIHNPLTRSTLIALLGGQLSTMLLGIACRLPITISHKHLWDPIYLLTCTSPKSTIHVYSYFSNAPNARGTAGSYGYQTGDPQSCKKSTMGPRGIPEWTVSGWKTLWVLYILVGYFKKWCYICCII